MTHYGHGGGPAYACEWQTWAFWRYAATRCASATARAGWASYWRRRPLTTQSTTRRWCAYRPTIRTYASRGNSSSRNRSATAGPSTTTSTTAAHCGPPATISRHRPTASSLFWDCRATAPRWPGPNNDVRRTNIFILPAALRARVQIERFI